MEIIANPDRFSPYYEKVVKDDGTISSGFMILFLDEEKTISSATGMSTSTAACSEWQTKVKKILENAQSAPKLTYNFPGHTFVVGEASPLQKNSWKQPERHSIIITKNLLIPGTSLILSH